MCTLGVGLKAAQDTRLVSATGYSFNANRRVGYFAYIRARRVPIGGTGPQWGDPSAAAGQYRSSCQMSLTDNAILYLGGMVAESALPERTLSEGIPAGRLIFTHLHTNKAKAPAV
jgi:hypothetical protein